MKQSLLLTLVISVIACSAAYAVTTTANFTVETVGASTTYTYVLSSGEEYDQITSFHVYTPFNYELITGWTTERDWLFIAGPDPEAPGGSDIYWTAPDPDNDGLLLGESITLSMTTSSIWPTDYSYELPGYLGNWGYDTAAFNGWVTVMISSVPVPIPTTVPEPCGALVLLAGISAVFTRLRMRGR